MQVIWKKLYKATSGSDHGTLFQLRNLVQFERRNVRKTPKKDFNAHHDFFSVVLTSHILAAAFEIFGMDNLDDEPCEGLLPTDIDAMTNAEKKEILLNLVSLIVDTYIDISPSLLEKEGCESEDGNQRDDFLSESDNSENEDDEDESNFETRKSNDGEKSSKKPIKTKGAPSKKMQSSIHEDDDKVKMYAEEILTLGLIYNEFHDAIKEGDGDRVMRCWKFLLPLFKASQRKNYSCEAFNLLALQKFVLSPRLSEQLEVV